MDLNVLLTFIISLKEFDLWSGSSVVECGIKLKRNVTCFYNINTGSWPSEISLPVIDKKVMAICWSAVCVLKSCS